MKIINPSPVEQMHIDIHGDNIMTIANVVCRFYGIPFNKVSQHDKKIELFKARAIICYLCHDQLHGCPLSVIGYILGGKNKPYDHASVRHSCQVMDRLINSKTMMGRWMNPQIRNEYQVIRGNAIYEINKGDSNRRVGNERASVFMDADVANRLNGHCDSTGISKSVFIRTSIINELNRIQYGVQV